VERTYNYPIHPLTKDLMKLTERHASNDPFFERHEASVISLLIYYLEELFSPFQDAKAAVEILQRNPNIFQYSLDVFQKAFSELPETSIVKQVFALTPFVQLTLNWENAERTIFMHTLAGLRRRFQVSEKSASGAGKAGEQLPAP